MVRTFGLKSDFSPIQQIGENAYKVCWDYQEVVDQIFDGEDEEGKPIPTGETKETDYATWMYEYVYSKPSEEYLKNLIYGWYNAQVDEKILNGFVWKDMPVWLSTENQFNYKAAYDLAVQTRGASLPVTFKFGTTLDPVYHTFTNLEEFTEFYFASIQYINEQLAAGWAKKDAINWDDYKINE